jgi:hypothetical protein
MSLGDGFRDSKGLPRRIYPRGIPRDETGSQHGP